MSSLPKRKFSELVQIYKYEPLLRDIYVEGLTDKHFYGYFLNQLGISKINFYPIELIDFVDEIHLDDLSNKNKLIQFSLKLEQTFSKSLSFITCISDKDYNDFIFEFVENHYLFFTDYTSLEMYLFTEEYLNKVLHIGLRGFPITAKELIVFLGEILQSIFIVNCSKYHEFKSAIPIKIDSVVKVKKNSRIDYNETEYLDKFLTRNALTKSKKQFEIKIEELKLLLTNDYRNQIRGKDFIILLNKVINVVKGNSAEFTEESLSRTLMMIPQPNDLINTNLFAKLIKRYS